MRERSKYVWDTSALISMTRSLDPYHLSCYQFIKEHEDDIHIFPAIAWFEFQAGLSRMERAGERILRDLYLLDGKNYVLDINQAFIRTAAELGLHLRFSSLRGADLIFACAAVIEEAALVTRDKAFLGLDGLRVIIPRRLSMKKATSWISGVVAHQPYKSIEFNHAQKG